MTDVSTLIICNFVFLQTLIMSYFKIKLLLCPTSVLPGQWRRRFLCFCLQALVRNRNDRRNTDQVQDSGFKPDQIKWTQSGPTGFSNLNKDEYFLSQAGMHIQCQLKMSFWWSPAVNPNFQVFQALYAHQLKLFFSADLSHFWSSLEKTASFSLLWKTRELHLALNWWCTSVAWEKTCT